MENQKCTKPNCDCAAAAEEYTGQPVKNYPCLKVDSLDLLEKNDREDKLWEAFDTHADYADDHDYTLTFAQFKKAIAELNKQLNRSATSQTKSTKK